MNESINGSKVTHDVTAQTEQRTDTKFTMKSVTRDIISRPRAQSS